MKSKQIASSFLVTRFVGRSEGDMVAQGYVEQLDLYRETLTIRATLQVIAMMGLSDPKHLDETQYARVADIAEAMGYERDQRKDGKSAFPTWIYQSIEETGLKLHRKYFPVFIREPSGFRKDGRRKWRTGLVDLSILQDFGFYYEDEDGQPIDLDKWPKASLIKIESVQGQALYAIPMTDDQGNFIRNKDGTIRRKAANAIGWTFSNKIAKLAGDRLTAWVFYREALPILRRYLKTPASFKLILKTLFWTGSGQIEIGHDRLAEHLGIKSNNTKQVQAAIDAAFEDAFNEKIIPERVKIKPEGYYKPTKATGKPRRKDKVYQWKRAAKWEPARNLIAPTVASLEPSTEGKPESPKS